MNLSDRIKRKAKKLPGGLDTLAAVSGISKRTLSRRLSHMEEMTQKEFSQIAATVGLDREEKEAWLKGNF